MFTNIISMLSTLRNQTTAPPGITTRPPTTKAPTTQAPTTKAATTTVPGTCTGKTIFGDYKSKEINAWCGNNSNKAICPTSWAELCECD